MIISFIKFSAELPSPRPSARPPQPSPASGGGRRAGQSREVRGGRPLARTQATFIRATGSSAVCRLRLRPYARLARLDRPIGTWLLLFPGWWGIALASQRWPDPLLLLLFAIGAVAMRGAGCTLNDIADRDYDGQVARTRLRPLPSGAVSVRQAVIFLLLQLTIGAAVLFSLNRTSDPARGCRSRADRHLPVHEAHHLLAAGISRPQFQLGSADRLDRGHRRARLAAAAALSSAACSGRSATTRSTRIRTRRTISASASNPRPSLSARTRGPGSSRSTGPRCCCGGRRVMRPGSARCSGSGLPLPLRSWPGRRRGWRPTIPPIACANSARTAPSAGCMLAGIVAGHFA